MTKAAEEGKGEQSLFHGLTTPDLAVLDILTVCYSDSNSDNTGTNSREDGEGEDSSRG